MKACKIIFTAAVLFVTCPAFSQDTIVVNEKNQADWAAGTIDSLISWSDVLMLDTVRTYNFNFSNCGQTGNTGPQQASVSSAYAGTDLAGAVTSDSGIQKWVTPQSGVYHFQTSGAGHGADTTFIRGAIIHADFEIAQSTALQILAGQMGDSPRGGNGGSFVTYADTTPLLIAGGAAGMRSYVDSANLGSTATSGQSVSGTGCSAVGGMGGLGGEALGGGNCSGAGGGLKGDGQGCGGGKAFFNGGTGGTANYVGGFGGGGGVNSSSSPGGGGGYSGGSVHYTGGGGSCAGGGGSYIKPTGFNVATSDGYYDNSGVFNGDSITALNTWHIGHGFVDITLAEHTNSGTRISPVHDISSPLEVNIYSSVEWQADVFAGTTFTVETSYSLNGGSSWSAWSAVSNGSPVAGLLPGTAMDNARLQTRLTFASTLPFASPQLYSITSTVINDSTFTGVSGITRSLKEMNVYPNPFAENVSIRYTLSQSSSVCISLYSPLGQVIELQPATLKQPGEHVAELSMKDLNLSSGMYWVEISADGECVRGKLLRY